MCRPEMHTRFKGYFEVSILRNGSSENRVEVTFYKGMFTFIKEISICKEENDYIIRKCHQW